MKIILLAFSVSAAAAHLHFEPRPVTRRSLRVNEDLKGTWGSLGLGGTGFCMEKIVDTTDTASDKVKFSHCDGTNPSQMWKFDKYGDGSFDPSGLVYNMDGGCLGIRGDYEQGKNLEILGCDRNNAKQHWVLAGDDLRARDERELCVTDHSEYGELSNKDPVVLEDCGGMSMDYDSY